LGKILSLTSVFLKASLIRSFIFREKEDIEAAVFASLDDEFDETDNEELRCGVARCPLSQTVWKDKDRLEKHR
jgi:hypothetical protein